MSSSLAFRFFGIFTPKSFHFFDNLYKLILNMWFLAFDFSFCSWGRTWIEKNRPPEIKWSHEPKNIYRAVGGPISLQDQGQTSIKFFRPDRTWAEKIGWKWLHPRYGSKWLLLNSRILVIIITWTRFYHLSWPIIDGNGNYCSDGNEVVEAFYYRFLPR